MSPDTTTKAPGAAHPAADGIRLWNRELLTLGHVDKDTFLNQVRPLIHRMQEVDEAFHEHVHPGEWGWSYCRADADGAVPITVCVPNDRELPDPADDLLQAARYLRAPAHPAAQIPYAAELADWLDSTAKNYETGIDDSPECPNCGEGCGGHPPVRYCQTCEENTPCACIKRPLALATRINALTPTTAPKEQTA